MTALQPIWACLIRYRASSCVELRSRIRCGLWTQLYIWKLNLRNVALWKKWGEHLPTPPRAGVKVTRGHRTHWRQSTAAGSGGQLIPNVTGGGSRLYLWPPIIRDRSQHLCCCTRVTRLKQTKMHDIEQRFAEDATTERPRREGHPLRTFPQPAYAFWPPNIFDVPPPLIVDATVWWIT